MIGGVEGEAAGEAEGEVEAEAEAEGEVEVQVEVSGEEPSWPPRPVDDYPQQPIPLAEEGEKGEAVASVGGGGEGEGEGEDETGLIDPNGLNSTELDESMMGSSHSDCTVSEG